MITPTPEELKEAIRLGAAVDARRDAWRATQLSAARIARAYLDSDRSNEMLVVMQAAAVAVENAEEHFRAASAEEQRFMDEFEAGHPKRRNSKGVVSS